MKRFVVLLAALAACAAFAAASPASGAARTGPVLAPRSGHSMFLANSAAYARALKSKDWVRTPDGLARKTCVHKFPAGAKIDNGVVIMASGARWNLACPYPTLVPSRSGPAAPASSSCEANNPAWWAEVCWNAPTWLDFMQEDFGAAGNPADDGALMFIFPALQYKNQDSILQPVLTWGANADNGITNPNIWYITSWYVYSGGYVYGNSAHVEAGAPIEGTLEATNCNGSGDCTWTVLTTDESTGQQSVLSPIGSDVPYTLVNGGVLEVATYSNCDQLPPSNQAAYRNLVVEDSAGDFLSPSFSAFTPDAHCGAEVYQYSSTGATIKWSS
jgi:hypothetical protein